jgi:predicted transcriptional regulator
VASEPSAYVEDIIEQRHCKINVDKSTQDVANMMSETNISPILVEDKCKIIGILTERDPVKMCAQKTARK